MSAVWWIYKVRTTLIEQSSAPGLLLQQCECAKQLTEQQCCWTKLTTTIGMLRCDSVLQAHMHCMTACPLAVRPVTLGLLVQQTAAGSLP
jgi:hypothetical protein